MRKIILLNLMLLVFASSVQAVDNFDPATDVLTIPSVMVGDLIYNNVSIQLDNYTVLGLGQNPTAGISLNNPIKSSGAVCTDCGLDIKVGDFSRGIPSQKDGRVSFSIKVTNTTDTTKYLASPLGTPNLSTLSDEKGNVCDTHVYDMKLSATINNIEFYNYSVDLHFSGIGVLVSRLDNEADIYNYTRIEPGRTKIIGVSSFNPAAVDASKCYFTGDYFTFQFYLWTYDTAQSKGELLYWDDFKNIPIPPNDSITPVAPLHPVTAVPPVTPVPVVPDAPVPVAPDAPAAPVSAPVTPTAPTSLWTTR